MTIKDKTVLVTGANRGIGQALAAEALARGARRVYAGTRQPLAHPDERVTPLSLDVTSTAQIQAAAGQVESLDMLINNAGIALPDDLTDPAALERHLAVNLFRTQRDRRTGRDRGRGDPRQIPAIWWDGLPSLGVARQRPGRHLAPRRPVACRGG
jgi:NAD(P)-dependent dehydrogenase (short-subunit alcohol dehydrogenase family)